jgi:hypothetical protein
VDQAAANKAANEAALKAWVESHTPLQILEANNARRRLAQLQGKRRVSIIHDDRLVKPPTSAWIYFFMEKRDKNALVVSDMAQDVAVQWKNLPASEKAVSHVPRIVLHSESSIIQLTIGDSHT